MLSVLVALLVFASLAVWLANQSPPRVTHAEAMAMALALEQARDLVELQQLVRFEGVPPSPPVPLNLGDPATDPAAIIKAVKQRMRYTFLGTRGEGTASITLMFRCHSDDYLGDYQELRLERFGDKVLVSDLWSMRLGGWTGSLLEERTRLSARPQVEAASAFTLAKAANDVAALEAAFRTLPPEYRDSLLIAREYLMSVDPENVDRFRAAVAEFRAAHPGSRAPDLLVVQYASLPHFRQTLREDALAAVDRIQARVGDHAYLQQVRTQLRG